MRWVLAIVLCLLGGMANAQPPLDLDALVRQECGPPGYRRPSGCTVKLPKGEYEIQPTKLGTCESPSTQRLGLILHGHSSGEWRQLSDVFPAPAGSEAHGYLEVRVLTTGGRLLSYASVVDNVTGDPIFVPGW